MNIHELRADFERRCLEHFKAKRDAGVPILDDNGSPATEEALFWKGSDGSYGVRAFNVAWTAYLWGAEVFRKDAERFAEFRKAAVDGDDTFIDALGTVLEPHADDESITPELIDLAFDTAIQVKRGGA